jgi:hypothetical protein
MAALNLYDNFRLRQLRGNGGADLTTATLKCMVVTSGYTPNQNTHVFRSSVTNEVSGSNYTAGGIAFGADTITMDGSGNISVDFDDAALTWTQHASGFGNGRRVVVYVDTGSSATDLLVAYSADFGADLGNVAADLTVVLNTVLFTAAR